jgi:hypothetical protein
VHYIISLCLPAMSPGSHLISFCMMRMNSLTPTFPSASHISPLFVMASKSESAMYILGVISCRYKCGDSWGAKVVKQVSRCSHTSQQSPRYCTSIRCASHLPEYSLDYNHLFYWSISCGNISGYYRKSSSIPNASWRRRTPRSFGRSMYTCHARPQMRIHGQMSTCMN